MVTVSEVQSMTPLLAFFLLQPPADPFAKWEKEVSAIEKRHTESPPKKGGVVFAGSSTIRLWDVKNSFPDWDVANCGFGGNQVRDNTHFAARLIFPLEPKAIVFYAGDNDVNAKRSPVQVRDDFVEFAKAVQGRLPGCTVYFLSIKPSVARWDQYETQQKANDLVKEVAAKNDGIKYVDVGPPLLGPDGKPKAELFQKDGLHLNEKGYALVAAEVRKAVK
jgi:lysophospholipase L1-like esterase